jgi:hypothetical protein
MRLVRVVIYGGASPVDSGITSGPLSSLDDRRPVKDSLIIFGIQLHQEGLPFLDQLDER